MKEGRACGKLWSDPPLLSARRKGNISADVRLNHRREPQLAPSNCDTAFPGMFVRSLPKPKDI
jgi:hypothetical protein